VRLWSWEKTDESNCRSIAYTEGIQQSFRLQTSVVGWYLPLVLVMVQFQNGLFGCFSNCCVCIVTYFFPCYTQGKVAEKVGESCILHGLLFFVPIADIICGAMIREKVRQNKGIEGSFVMDCLTIFFCFPCALCQEGNEVDAFGRNMAMSMARE